MDRVYEDYEPYYEWDKDEGRFTFLIAGYKRDELKMQVITSKPALKLKGERPVFGNRWRRFDVEYPIPPDYDLGSVRANFEGGRLHVRFSRQAAKEETSTTNPTEETSRPKEEAEPSQKVDQKNDAKQDKAESKTNEVSEQKTPQKEKEKENENVPSDEKEKSKREAEDSREKVDNKENENFPSDEKEKNITEIKDGIEKDEKKENVPSEGKEKSKTEKEDDIEKVAEKENETSDEKRENKSEAEDGIEKVEKKENVASEVTEDSIEKVTKKENETSDEKGKNRTETEDSTEKVEKKEDKTNNNNDITENKKSAIAKAPETKDVKPMTRFKTRILDFGPSLGPFNQAYSGELENLDVGPNKKKRMVSCGLLTLLVVGLGLYAKNTFIASHGGSKFDEL